MWRRVNLVKTDVSKERVISTFEVKKYESEKSVTLFANSVLANDGLEIREYGCRGSVELSM
jgi:hypothetical protein